MQNLVIALTAILGFTIASSGYAPSYAQSHNYFWGIRNKGDTLALKQYINVDPLPIIVTRDVVFPSPGKSNNRPITAIRAYDQIKNGTGAYVTIKSGGVKSTHSVINFSQSQRGRGINFLLEIYVG